MKFKSHIRAVKYRSYKGEVGKIAKNVLQRKFKANRPNQKWVTDVTEFNVRGEKLYLSPVMDLFNGEIIAFQTGRRPLFGLVKDMLQKSMDKLKSNEKHSLIRPRMAISDAILSATAGRTRTHPKHVT